MSTSTWEDIKQSANALARQIGKKTEELTDLAALRIKLSARQSDLEEAYTALGKCAYEELYSRPAEAPSQDKAEADAAATDAAQNASSADTDEAQKDAPGTIREAADRVTALLNEIAQLKQTLEEKKQKGNA